MDHTSDLPGLSGFYLIGLLAAAAGLIIIFLINTATPLEYVISRIQFVHQLSSTEWARYIGFRLSVFCLTITASLLPFLLVLHRVLAPVDACLAHFKAGLTPGPDTFSLARRRIINLPFIMGPVVVISWTLAPILLLLLSHHLGRIDSAAAITFALRSLMMGVVSAAVIFFGMESHARRTLVPLFFPQGELYRTPKTARLPIYSRIRAFYRIGSLLPLANVVLTLFILYWQVNPDTVDAKTYGQGVLIFSLVVFLLFLLASGYISRVVAKSISTPMADIMTALKAVRDGNLDARVKVISNDEVGILGDATNTMIKSLKEKQVMREAFGRHVTPDIRDEIIAGNIPLDGEYKDVTVLFSDLRDFTAMSETADPKDMVRCLNRYFTEMDQAVQAQGGLIFQFLGDGIYAVFGAPVPCSDHAQRAFDAALEMNRRLERLNREFGPHNQPPLAQGIGLHSGRVVAANMGSAHRRSYLLVGDTVNLASRLQELTKQLDARMILSRETAQQLTHRAPLDDFQSDHLRVRGRQSPTAIHYLPRQASPAGV